MRKAILLLAVPALAAGVGLVVRGQGPVPAEPAAGKVLLLKSERILEGDVERAAGQYVLRRGTSEVTINANQALRLCADRADAYQFMQGRANLLDPDERLRLARWCQSNGLAEQAREEVKAALEMRPNHAETRRLAKLLEHQAPAGRAAATTAPPPAPPPLPNVNLSFETVTAFATKVQPILMNTCVNCHSGGRGGSFQLSRVYEGGQRASTQRNVTAVLAQVNFEKPAGSPLLIMALSAHGNQNGPPLPGKQAPTYQAIVQWLERAIADNPHLSERFAAAPAPRVVSDTPVQRVSVPAAEVVSRPVARIEDQAAPAKLPASVGKSEPVAPTPKPFVPRDEFDAESFNRQARPKD